MVFYIFYIPSTIACVISLYLIERGAYISEQAKSGYENGALHYYMLFAYSGMLVFYIFSKNINLVYLENLSSKYKRKIFILSSFLMFVFLVYINAHNNIYTTRFNVFNISPIFQKVGNILNVMYGIFFFYIMIIERKLYNMLFFASLYIFVQYMSFSQFGTFIYAVEMVFIAYILSKKKKLPWYIFTKLGFVLGSLGIVFILFVLIYKMVSLGSLELLFNRFILTAHMFWGSIEYNTLNGAQPINFNALFDSFFIWSKSHISNPDVGLGALMKSIGDPRIVDGFIRDNVRFSLGYPSILIYYFGLVGASFLHIFLSIMYVYYLKYQVFLIGYFNAIVFILFMKITHPLLDLFLSGEFSGINLKMFVYLIVLFSLVYLYHFVRKGKNYENNNI